jgi:hypothetical protein
MNKGIPEFTVPEEANQYLDLEQRGVDESKCINQCIESECWKIIGHACAWTMCVFPFIALYFLFIYSFTL